MYFSTFLHFAAMCCCDKLKTSDMQICWDLHHVLDKDDKDCLYLSACDSNLCKNCYCRFIKICNLTKPSRGHNLHLNRGILYYEYLSL